MVKHLFLRKTVPVEFRDVPERPIDTSAFDQVAYASILAHGLTTRFLSIIHAAAAHYQSRFRRFASMRFINAFLDLIPVVAQGNTDVGLRLVDNQSSELQARSSEVLGVGLCVLLASRLLGVNRNRIVPVEGSGKRCDFRVLKNDRVCHIEAKARKNHANVPEAISDILGKKLVLPNPRLAYGFVSHVPRNDGDTSMIVVDPERDDVPLTRSERIATLLGHYCRVSSLAGFWRLAELVNARAIALQSGTSLESLNRRPLELDSVGKLGRAFRVMTRFGQFDFFAARDPNLGLRVIWGKLVFVLGLDPHIFELLVAQDFDGLEDYFWRSPEGSDSEFEEQFIHSVSSDGSALIAVPTNFE